MKNKHDKYVKLTEKYNKKIRKLADEYTKKVCKAIGAELLPESVNIFDDYYTQISYNGTKFQSGSYGVRFYTGAEPDLLEVLRDEGD